MHDKPAAMTWTEAETALTVMNFVALKMLTRDRTKYLGLIFTIALSSFPLANQT
jgi:hypothetical protein